MPQEGQEGNAYHIYDKDGIELESVPDPSQAQEMAEPIGGYVIYGGVQTTDDLGNVLRVGGKMHADYRGADQPVDAAEDLSDEDRERLLAQQNRQAAAPAAAVVQGVSGDLGVMAACVLGGLASRPDFEPGVTDDQAVMLAVNLAQKIAEHPMVQAQRAATTPGLTVQGAPAPAGNVSIFSTAQANTMKGPDGNPIYIPPKRVKMVKNGRTFYVDPNSPEGQEAAKQQALREARGRPATDY